MFGIIFSFVASQILYFALHLESSSFPKPLSARDEIAAFEAMKNGDMAARDKLIRHNLRLVAHIVKKYYASSTDQEDLISIGTIGLIKAVNSFDNTKGARFPANAAGNEKRIQARPVMAAKTENSAGGMLLRRCFHVLCTVSSTAVSSTRFCSYGHGSRPTCCKTASACTAAARCASSIRPAAVWGAYTMIFTSCRRIATPPMLKHMRRKAVPITAQARPEGRGYGPVRRQCVRKDIV